MDKIIINYSYSKSRKNICLIAGIYGLLYAAYNAIILASNETYSIEFFAALLAVLLSLLLIIMVTIFASKPIFEMDNVNIYSKAGLKKTIYRADWERIKNVSIGLSYLKITEVGGKENEVDLSELKYSDLKIIKSKIIELCEAKMIPYQND